jgi:RNA polymerase sigma-70 factor (ECF subfamily)
MSATLNATESTGIPSSSLSDLSDEEVLLRYRETEDRDLFQELVRRYERELFSYLRRYLGSRDMAEDAFQGAFLQVHLKCHQFEAGRRVKPWLYAIATNQAIDAQRRNRRHRMVSLDYLRGYDEGDGERNLSDLMASREPSPAARVGNEERKQQLQRVLNELSDQMRTVVHLVYYQGLKYREAAEVLSIPVGTVKSRLHAAIAKLAECWNRDHADELD